MLREENGYLKKIQKIDNDTKTLLILHSLLHLHY